MNVFVSYRSSERQQVRELVAFIEQAGDYQTWYDQEIVGGQQWWDEILKALKAADIVVLALSPAYLQSDPCRRELDYAQRLGKAIIPVQIDPALDYGKLGLKLTTTQVVRFPASVEDRDTAGLLKALQAAQPGQPSADTTPPSAPVSPLDQALDVVRSLQPLPPEEQQRVVDALRRHLRRFPDDGGRVRDLLQTLLKRAEATHETHQEGAEVLAGIRPARRRWPLVVGAGAIVLLIAAALILSRNPSGPTTPTITDTPAIVSPTSEAIVTTVPPQTGPFDLTLIYGSRDSLTVKLNGASHLFGLTLETPSQVETLADDFPALSAAQFVGASGDCLRYIREGSQPTLPRGCNPGQTFEKTLAEADVFWFDTRSNQYQDMALKQSGTLINLCPSANGAGRCDFSS